MLTTLRKMQCIAANTYCRIRHICAIQSFWRQTVCYSNFISNLHVNITIDYRISNYRINQHHLMRRHQMLVSLLSQRCTVSINYSKFKRLPHFHLTWNIRNLIEGRKINSWHSAMRHREFTNYICISKGYYRNSLRDIT